MAIGSGNGGGGCHDELIPGKAEDLNKEMDHIGTVAPVKYGQEDVEVEEGGTIQASGLARSVIKRKGYR